jgi:hypothetical protein
MLFWACMEPKQLEYTLTVEQACSHTGETSRPRAPTRLPRARPKEAVRPRSRAGLAGVPPRAALRRARRGLCQHHARAAADQPRPRHHRAARPLEGGGGGAPVLARRRGVPARAVRGGGLRGGRERDGDAAHRLPQPVRHGGHQALAARGAAARAGHVGGGPGLIEEHQPHGIEPRRRLDPSPARFGYVGTVLLGGAQPVF